MRSRFSGWLLALAVLCLALPAFSAQNFTLDCRADRYATGSVGTLHAFHVPLSANAPGDDSVDVRFETHLPSGWMADWCQKSTSQCFIGNQRIRLLAGVSDSLTITFHTAAGVPNMGYVDLEVRAAVDPLDLERCTYTYFSGLPIPPARYTVNCSDNTRFSDLVPGVTYETFLAPIKNTSWVDDSLIVRAHKSFPPPNWVGEICVVSSSQCYLDSAVVHLPAGGEDTLQVTMRHFGRVGSGSMDLEIHSGSNPSITQYCHYQLFLGIQPPVDVPLTSRVASPWALRAVPNPFSEQTALRLRAPTATQGLLAIFGPDGRRVRTYPGLILPAGESSIRWDGRKDDGSPAPSGVYFYRLFAPGTELRGMLIRTR